MGGNINRFRGRRLAAALGALTLSLVGAVSAATPASAADDYGNIDAAKRGSILIHKHVYQSGTPVTYAPDGSVSDSALAGVADVRFTAYPLTSLNLTVAASWTTLSTLAVPSTACDTVPPTTLSGQPLGTGLVSSLTLADGTASIANLPVSAYLVCETTTPSTVVDKAQPFVVTIPYSYKRPSGTAESWLYDVNVYPKNGLASITKTVAAQSSLGLGSTASFAVTTDVPKIASNATFQYYWVQDAMDSRMTGAVASVKVASSGTDVLSTYYTWSTIGANVVSVQFNNAGLTWLSTLGPAKIITTFTGAVTGALGTGVISDTAYLGTKSAVGSVPTTPASAPADPSGVSSLVSSARVTQNWGDLAVRKVDAGSSTTGLAGAVFEVYATATQDAGCTSIVPTGSAILVSGATQFTSGSTGLLSIAGLFVSDSVNGPVSATQRCYVLKEVTAPVGFILPATPYSAVVVKTGVTNTSVAYDASIQNTRFSGVVLPMTGSNGIVVLSVAGLALIAAGIVLAFLARRRRQTA